MCLSAVELAFQQLELALHIVCLGNLSMAPSTVSPSAPTNPVTTPEGDIVSENQRMSTRIDLGLEFL